MKRGRISKVFFLDIKKGTFGNGQILGSKEVDIHVGN
jgi:hypothetical protein